MDDGWRDERQRVAASFDRVADLYRREFADELERKPFDRALLDRVARRFPRDRPVLEVGAGPAHVSAYLADRGVAVIASDASLGQLREAHAVSPTRPLTVADVTHLPVRPDSLGGIVAFYCLIYGPPEPLDHVFADWRRALHPGGVALIAAHAGSGVIHHPPQWHGRPIDITVVLRDPDDLAARLEQAGFGIDELTVRPAYPDEHPTDRCYLTATRRNAR